MNYRDDARRYLDRCKEELGSGDDERLKYAALELRMAMEAVTYDRALAYKDEFPPDEYETWQPRKVMSVLLDIDPTADLDSSVAIGIQEVTGVPASVMTPVGSEKILNMAILKKHYDALGSYLHVQTLKQVLNQTPPDANKIRSRCKEVANFVEAVLSSEIFNVVVGGDFAKLDCMNCGKKIRKRIPHGQSEVRAKCYQCPASYTLVDKGNCQVVWKPDKYEFKCPNSDCEHKIIVWLHEIEVWKRSICSVCNGKYFFDLAIRQEG